MMRFICARLQKWQISGDLHLTMNGLTGACLSPASLGRELADCYLSGLVYTANSRQLAFSVADEAHQLSLTKQSFAALKALIKTSRTFM